MIARLIEWALRHRLLVGGVTHVATDPDTPASMPFTWVDSGASNDPVRFFRVLLGP